MDIETSFIEQDQLVALLAAVGTVVTIGGITGTLRNVYVTGGMLAVSVCSTGDRPDFHMGAVGEETTIRI